MKMRSVFIFTILILCVFHIINCNGQKTVSGANILQFVQEIPMTSVTGRIDHLAINLKEQVVYVAALGNNTVEVVDLRKGSVIKSLTGLDEPQGIAYIGKQDEICIANGGNGACYFYNARNFNKTATIRLGDDADNVRYDSVENKIYVGYGSGGIALIDAKQHLQIADVKLPAHPESFQIDYKAGRLYVNLPNAKMIGEVDIKQLKLIQKWPNGSLASNFPMALDTAGHRLFVGYRNPAKMAVIDTKTGNLITSANITGDVDDLFFDSATASIFTSGGDGYISILRQQENGAFETVSTILTRKGARTSLFVPQLRLYILAARAEGNKSAALIIYKVV